MNTDSYIIMTNNPLVLEKLEDRHNVLYRQSSYEELLKDVRDRIHDGHRLLTHPLSGSVKPNETPYKSILITKGKEKMDEWSLQMIESAIQACRKFAFKAGGYSDDVRRDFQLIDWTLLESGLASAGA